MKKLSQMNFEEGANAVGTLSMAFADILDNPKIEKLMQDTFDWKSFIIVKDGKTTADMPKIVKSITQGGMKIITRLLGAMLKENFESVAEIISIFTEKSIDEVKKMSIIDVTLTFKEIFKDEDLLKLFTSVQKEKKLEATQ